MCYIPSNTPFRRNCDFFYLGYKLLKQSGWDGKSGLGTAEHKGRLFPVKSVLKRDRTGIQVCLL